MDILYNSDTTRVSVINKGTKDVFISFNGLTGTYVDEEYPEVVDEFKSLAKTYTTFFVADKTMSWGNNVEWEEVAKVINPLIKNKKAIAVGLSMGGSNAIISSSFLNLKKVVAFNPQYTIYPEFHPETLYLKQAEAIKDWKFKTIYHSFNKNTQYIICWSTQEVADTFFLGLFPKFINNINFGNQYSHNLAGDLKKDKRLERFFKLVVKDNIEDLIRFSENKI